VARSVFRSESNTVQLNAAAAFQLHRAVCLSGMLREETWSFTNQHIQWDDGDMKTFNPVEKTKVSRPIERIEPPRCASKLIAEWQEHGPETLSGLAVRKLRLSFAPSQLMVAASAAA
jgi:hypothetical protein